MKQLYVVLGMARSGTSAMARGLQALGIQLGEKLTPGAERWNAKGFFEDNEIVYKINRTALHLMDSPWGMRPLANAAYGEHATMQKLHTYAATLLSERTANTEHWGFKDPRTATLLPFWQPIFSELNFDEHYLIALRNPLASAASYQSLSGCDLEEALIMWLMHMVPAIDGTHGKSRVVVNYDLLMHDPRLQLNRIKQALHVPELADQAQIDQYANDFIDRKLQRHERTVDDLKFNAAVAVTPLAIRVYDILLRLAKDEITFADQTFTAEWAGIMVEFNKQLPFYNYAHHLLAKSKLLERELRTIRKSFVWKLVYPLRIIDDVLRQRRKNARERKRLRYATEA